jgi:adenine-specific DNA-methyltransferase
MKLYATLETVLKTEPNFVTDEGELKKWVVISKAQNYDAELIGLLLDEPELKAHFFIPVRDVFVFKQDLFIEFMEQKNYLNDSYTAYKNKIGLTIDGKFLNQRNEVALVWPYKDCVLEGGQSREEDKREEIFFNEVLAQDEISQLLEPKVLTNAKTYTIDGEKAFEGFNRNEEGTITDNLIIKGNNLLALHSLKEEFAGKVKLIYIDPPFNTGKDEFKYNDSFNHSTWLTFMRNRLEVAKLLLQKEGTICVHVGNEEASYTQVLLDDVFKRENYLNHITMTTNAASGFKATSAKIFSTANHIFLYAKAIDSCNLNKIYVPKKYDDNYKYYLLNSKDHFSKWKYTTIVEELARIENFGDIKTFKLTYTEEVLLNKIIEFAEENKARVFRTAAIGGGALKKRKLTIEKSKKEKGKVIQHPNEDVDGFYILNGEQIVFWSNTYKEIDGIKVPATTITDVWTDVGFTGIANEGGVTLKNGKKPEQLLKRIIELATFPNEIVLDYHLGSGTTIGVAHKINRQYIGIEQLDYNENDSIIRIKNVINGDKTGISKSVNWQGGGSLTYLELKKYNQTFIDTIQEAKDTKTLLAIWEEMKAKSFMSYNIAIQKQEQHIEEFKLLEFDEQQKLLITLLDKNQLYVNLSSLHDKDFECSIEELKVTRDFYQLKR